MASNVAAGSNHAFTSARAQNASYSPLSPLPLAIASNFSAAFAISGSFVAATRPKSTFSLPPYAFGKSFVSSSPSATKSSSDITSVFPQCASRPL